MKTQNIFRLTKLALVMGVALTGLNANAVYNIYKKAGLTLDVNGQVDVQVTKNDSTSTILKTSNDWYFNDDGDAVYRTYAAGTVLKDTDKKPRLNQNQGVSFVDFRGAQVMANDWRVTGNVGLGYSDSRSLYLNNASLSFDKKNVGAITLGRQYLHTNYVNRTGTDTPLDIFGSSAVRLDYYKLKNLHASAYYSFTGSNDVRVSDDTALDSGYGASLSYRVPFGNSQSVRFGLGYTESKFNPVTNSKDWVRNTLNQYPVQSRGMAASLEYQAGKLLLAADYGQKKETMSSDPKVAIGSKTTDYLGAKIAFDINPVWQVSAGYGVKKTSPTLKAGRPALSNDPLALLDTGLGRPALFSYVSPLDKHLFDKAETKEMYVQADYRVRPNVRLYGRYDTETTTYKLAGSDLSQDKDNNARLGVVFSF